MAHVGPPQAAYHSFGVVEAKADSPVTRSTALAHSSASIATLSDDTIHHVFSFLDGASLCRCEAVCRDFRTLASDKQTWKQAMAADFRMSRLSRGASLLSSMSMRGLDPKNAYRSRFQAIQRRRRNAEADRERLARTTRRRKYWRCYEWVTHVCIHFPFWCVLAFAWPVFLLLLTRQVDEEDPKDKMKYWVVFLPLDVAAGLAVVSRLLSCVGWWNDRGPMDRSPWRAINKVIDGESAELLAMVISVLFVVSLGVTPFLAHLKLDGDLDIDWQIVVIPVYAAFAFGVCGSTLNEVTLIIPALAFFGLLTSFIQPAVSWADGASFNLELGLIPWMVVFSIVFIGMCGAHIAIQRDEADRWWQYLVLFFGFLLGLAFLAAFVVPLVVLVLRSHGDAENITLRSAFWGVIVISFMVTGYLLKRCCKQFGKFKSNTDGHFVARAIGRNQGVFGRGNV